MGAAHSKLTFKKSVFRLFEEQNIPSNANEYWEQFWTLPETTDDVFSLVSSADIRQVRDNARENLECLIEKSEEWMDWEERYFWIPRTVVVSVKRPSMQSNTDTALLQETTEHPQQQQQHQAQNSTGNRTAAKEEFLELEEKPVPSHGHRLIQILIDLLFTSGFTIPTAVETKERVSYVIWETGIGSSTPIGTSKEFEDNRIEVLRLLLVLFSRSMYITPALIPITENRWIETVVTSTNRKATITVLCSLINSAMKYNPSGWGLPYNHVMFSNDQRELLVMLCLQVIIVLLNYQPIDVVNQITSNAGALRIGNPTSSSVDANTPTSSTQSPPTPDLIGKNQFRYYLSRLHREQDFTFLMDGMYRILSNPMAASSTYLPGSTKQVKCHQEMLMLCWRTLELNKRFRLYLLDTHRVLDIVIILLYFAMENKLDPSHIGVVRMCACMLHTLSSDRAFGSSLNKPFDGHASLPSNMRIPNFHGTYGDYLVQSIHNLIATTKRTLRSLYPSLVITLLNISPSLKRISAATANRLFQLTVSFGSPSFLLAEPSNHELLGYMLDVISNILYYQASDNPNLIYAMVQYESKLRIMAKFTLASGLEDIHRLRLAKERQAVASNLSREQLQQQQQVPRRPNLGPRHMSADKTSARTNGTTKRPLLKTRTSTSTLSSNYTPTHSTFGNPLGSHSASDTATHLPPVYPDESASSIKSRNQHKPEDLSLSSVVPTERSEDVRHNYFSRLDSTDAILAPPSDGGGHDGDVEDEGGLSTVPRTRKMSGGSGENNANDDLTLNSGLPTSLEGLSEKQRGKLPEALAERLSRASSDQENEPESDNLGRKSPPTRKHGRRPAGPSPLSNTNDKGAERAGTSQSLRTWSSYDQLEARSITSKGTLLTTTVYNVGQNGFVPTEEWVTDWMSTMHFEPALVALKYIVPAIEQLHATTDQQVLEFIQREIAPQMLTSILPSYGSSAVATMDANRDSSPSSTPTILKPPITMHKFVWGELAVWFEGLVWSQIYLGGMGRLGRQGMGAWHETRVRLFMVRTTSTSHQQQSPVPGAKQHHTHVVGSSSNYTNPSSSSGGASSSRGVTTAIGSSTASYATTQSQLTIPPTSPASSSLSNTYNSNPRTLVTASPISPTFATAPNTLF
ncbi:hypothetical protein BGW42_008162 [Actinomortierella wolfii]|nr:hypothetical protein BGW42_008162 [Actinomortierella wolfii]